MIPIGKKIQEDLVVFLLAKELVCPRYKSIDIPPGTPYNHQETYLLWQTLK